MAAVSTRNSHDVSASYPSSTMPTPSKIGPCHDPGALTLPRKRSLDSVIVSGNNTGVPKRGRGRPPRSNDESNIPTRRSARGRVSSNKTSADIVVQGGETCLSKKLLPALQCTSCQAASDPIKYGIKNKENLRCRQLWVEENCASLEDYHARDLIISHLQTSTSNINDIGSAHLVAAAAAVAASPSLLRFNNNHIHMTSTSSALSSQYPSTTYARVNPRQALSPMKQAHPKKNQL